MFFSNSAVSFSKRLIFVEVEPGLITKILKDITCFSLESDGYSWKLYHSRFPDSGVSGALAYSADRALDLSCPCNNACESIGDGKTEIVMDMHRNCRLVDIGNAASYVAHHLRYFLRCRIADGVGQIHRRSSGCDGGFDSRAEEVRIAAGSVLGGKLHFGALPARIGDHCPYLFERPFARHAQLVLQMQIACCEKRMDARMRRRLQGLRRRVDILRKCAGKGSRKARRTIKEDFDYPWETDEFMNDLQNEFDMFSDEEILGSSDMYGDDELGSQDGLERENNFESCRRKKTMKEDKLNDFGKHPGYRKKPMNLPPTGEDKNKWGRDWNDESVYSEEPFGSKIGSSAPFDIVQHVTDSIMEQIKKKR